MTSVAPPLLQGGDEPQSDGGGAWSGRVAKSQGISPSHAPKQFVVRT